MTSNKYLIPSIYIHSFFILGLVSTLAIRLIIVVKHIHADLIRPFWYIGIIGYIAFFAYRYYITQKRKKLIIQHDLIQKVHAAQDFNDDDKELLSYIVSSIVKSREHINYLFIFASSIVAIIVDISLEMYLNA